MEVVAVVVVVEGEVVGLAVVVGAGWRCFVFTSFALFTDN